MIMIISYIVFSGVKCLLSQGRHLDKVDYLEYDSKEVVQGDQKRVLPLPSEVHGKGWVLLHTLQVRQNCEANIEMSPCCRHY